MTLNDTCVFATNFLSFDALFAANDNIMKSLLIKWLIMMFDIHLYWLVPISMWLTMMNLFQVMSLNQLIELVSSANILKVFRVIENLEVVSSVHEFSWTVGVDRFYWSFIFSVLTWMIIATVVAYWVELVSNSKMNKLLNIFSLSTLSCTLNVSILIKHWMSSLIFWLIVNLNSWTFSKSKYFVILLITMILSIYIINPGNP